MSAYSLGLTQNDWDSPELLDAWGRLIGPGGGPGDVEKCPEYLGHLLGTGDASQFHLATLRDGAGAVIGVVPLRVVRAGLRVNLSGRVLWESRARAVSVLGGVPLLPADPDCHDLVFAAIDEGLPHYPAIALPGVPVESYLWRYLHDSTRLRDRFLLYPMDGVRLCHTLRLPATGDEYWARMGRKKRYNLRRQSRLLNDSCGGRLRLVRFDSPDQVGDLLGAVNPSEAFAGLNRWNRLGRLTIDRREAEGLAGLGLLLNFVLMCGDRPCAALTGLQYGGTYYLDGVSRDRALNRFSPGSTVFHMAMEDLIGNTPIRRVDLGFGEPAYSHSSTNTVEPRASVLLLRKTPANRLRRGVHASSRSLIDLAKRCLRYPSS